MTGCQVLLLQGCNSRMLGASHVWNSCTGIHYKYPMLGQQWSTACMHNCRCIRLTQNTRSSINTFFQEPTRDVQQLQQPPVCFLTSRIERDHLMLTVISFATTHSQHTTSCSKGKGKGTAVHLCNPPNSHPTCGSSDIAVKAKQSCLHTA